MRPRFAIFSPATSSGAKYIRGSAEFPPEKAHSIIAFNQQGGVSQARFAASLATADVDLIADVFDKRLSQLSRLQTPLNVFFLRSFRDRV